MKRVENTLFVGIGNTTTLVEVLPNARIIIPGVSDQGNVNQLKHHLEIQRMSKSKGNVVNPDELVAKYGADVVRSYLMGNFDWQKGGPWNDEQITGVIRWLNDVWDIATNPIEHHQGDEQIERQMERRLHQTINDVNYGLEKFGFNTCIAALMKLRNTLRTALKTNGIGRDSYRNAMNVMLRLIAPFAPHIAEELWEKMGFGYSVHQQSWPEYDAEKAKEDAVPLVIMINGRPRGTIEVAADIAQAEAESIALSSEHAVKALNGSAPQKVIYIAGKEPKVNIVTGK
jgi:leucyl-tRNA synthetase